MPGAKWCPNNSILQSFGKPDRKTGETSEMSQQPLSFVRLTLPAMAVSMPEGTMVINADLTTLYVQLHKLSELCKNTQERVLSHWFDALC